jgi:lipopolysaccharide transport protein LptA
MQAWGKRIDYQLNTEFLTLLGGAKLIQKGNLFSGHQILFNMSTENVKATGGKDKQVKMIFLPNSN